MTAFLLAPFYILVNVYVVRWMIRWMGACSHIFQSAVFRAVFIIFYIHSFRQLATLSLPFFRSSTDVFNIAQYR